MKKLFKQLNKYKRKLKDKYDLSNKFLDELYSVYHFNKSEYVINHLLAKKNNRFARYNSLI